MYTADDSFLSQRISFDPSVDIGQSDAPQLAELTKGSPDIKIYTKSSPHFQSLKGIWNLKYERNEPLALIRPAKTSQVSTIIKYCVSNNLPITVRCGGHDLWGRSVVTDAVIIDIRELDSITLAEDKSSVVIGGGTMTGALTDFLDSHGLATAATLAGGVGQIGWAFSGGFGPLACSLGLGVDHIIGAKIITADGQLQVASDELLWGIKGAGGAFGVITEVTLKTHSLPKMLGGMLMFPFQDAARIIGDYQALVKEGNIPAPFTGGFNIIKRGNQSMLAMLFSWASSDFVEGQKWLAKLKGLGTVLMDMVSETTFKKWSDSLKPMLPPPSYSTSRSIFISTLSPQAIEILVKYASLVPDGAPWAVSMIPMFGQSIKPQVDSCFSQREPFIFIHALAPSKEESGVDGALTWAKGLADEMKDTGLFKSNYLSIMAPDQSVEEAFGKANFERLKLLKKKIDPGNVFSNVPAKLI